MLGAGTVHHIAWRTPTDATQLEWRRTLVSRGYNVSPVMDRQYFRSIYFREPGGVLFEVATMQPGFTIDEPLGELGRGLKLPPWSPVRRIPRQRGVRRGDTRKPWRVSCEASAQAGYSSSGAPRASSRSSSATVSSTSLAARFSAS